MPFHLTHSIHWHHKKWRFGIYPCSEAHFSQVLNHYYRDTSTEDRHRLDKQMYYKVNDGMYFQISCIVRKRAFHLTFHPHAPVILHVENSILHSLEGRRHYNILRRSIFWHSPVMDYWEGRLPVSHLTALFQSSEIGHRIASIESTVFISLSTFQSAARRSLFWSGDTRNSASPMTTTTAATVMTGARARVLSTPIW